MAEVGMILADIDAKPISREDVAHMIFGDHYKQVVTIPSSGPFAKFDNTGPRPQRVTAQGKEELKSCVMCAHSRWSYDRMDCIRKRGLHSFSENALIAIANDCENYNWTGVPYHMAKKVAWDILTKCPDGRGQAKLIWKA
jgi:hypothetical protein